MDLKKLGIGLGAFAAGAAAWVWGASRFGDRVAPALDAALDHLPAVTGGGQGAPAEAPADTGAGTGAGTAPSARLIDVEPDAGAGMPAATPPAGQGGGEGGGEGHVPTDLLSDEPVTRETRAPEAFRPDPTAVPTAEEREALRPATGPAPSLAADRGSSIDTQGAA